jgi:putative flippase GtrA
MTHNPPVVPIPQDPFIPRRRLQRIVNRLRGAQFVRYLAVGLFNTVFGYSTFALTLFLLTHAVPQRYLYLTVVAASLICTPLNITVAYFGYKFFVFKTRGNYLIEWFKCFGVYGLGMLPGLFALSAVTRLLQSMFHQHHAALHTDLGRIAAHLHGPALTLLRKMSSGKAAAGYLAGAIVQSFTTVASFVGHKRVTFKTKTSHPINSQQTEERTRAE